MKRTIDRAQSDVYTVEKLGRTQEITPEGFLLCRDVPIARVGEMLYAPGEVPVRPGKDFISRVSRDEAVLLHVDTLASFEGKAVTIDHPNEDVNPDNWEELAKGFARNVRVGEGDQAGHMVADLLITSRKAIAQVRDGLREVSLGYDAEYEDLGGGFGRQIRITGNHVALVLSGRCGPMCSIGDSDMKTRDKSQKTTDRKAWSDRLRGYFLTRDEDGFVKELEGAPDVAEIDGDDKTHNITINLQGAAPAAGPVEAAAAVGEVAAPADPMAAVMTMLESINTRLSALEGVKADPDPVDEDDDVIDEDDDDDETTKDKKTVDSNKKTKDSSSLQEQFTETLARAEILSPGIKLPTFDRKADFKQTFDSICGLRRRALSKVSDDHRELIAPVLEGLDLKKATCDSIKHVFIAASELARKSTNDHQFKVTRPVKDSSAKNIPTIAEINKKNREAWDKKTS